MRNSGNRWGQILATLGLLLFICTACEEGAPPPNDSKDAILEDPRDRRTIKELPTPTKMPKVFRSMIGAYYELDEKYFTANDSNPSALVRGWLQLKIEEIEVNGMSEDRNLLRNRGGGGPNGAHWNPSTNLWLFARITPDIEGEFDTQIILNDQRLPIPSTVYPCEDPEQECQIIVAFIPYKAWFHRLRLIREEELPMRYTKDQLKAYETGGLEAAGFTRNPMESEVVYFGLRLTPKDKSQPPQFYQGVFDASFGE
ncbi:MAG: hypothetical protein AAF570_22735 [Bacteroidota bacterium]